MTTGRFQRFFRRRRRAAARVARGAWVVAGLGDLPAPPLSRARRSPRPGTRLRPGRPVGAPRMRRRDEHEVPIRNRRSKPARCTAVEGRDRGAQRDLLPGPEPDPPRRSFPPQGALGRLGRARLEVVAEAGREALHASCRRPASTASRRAGCSPTSTGRPCEVRKFEGNPEHPGSRGRNCAKGPATLNQITTPTASSIPLKRVGKRGERASGSGSRWDEALDDIAGRIRKAIRDRPPERDHVPRRPARRGRLHRARARGLGRRRPQLAHQHLLVGGARRLPVLDGHRPPEPRSRQRRGDPAHLRAPRVRALLQSARPADHRGQEERREADRGRHAAVEHAPPTPTTGSRRSRAREAAILLAIANYHHPGQALQPRVRAPLVELAGVPGAELHPTAPPTFERFEAMLGARVRGLHLRVRRRRVRGRGGDPARGRRDRRRRPAPRLSTHTWRSAAAGNEGGWQVARTLFLLNALLGAVATEGGTYPNAWNKFVPRPIHLPPQHPDKLERADLAARVPARR